MKPTTISFARVAMLSIKTRAALVGATVFTVLAGSMLADVIVPAPTPEPSKPKPKLRVTVDDRPERFNDSVDAIYNNNAPHHPANMIQTEATSRIVDRLRELQAKGATAGAESKASKEVAPPQDSLNLSMYGEYSYLSSNDKRQLDTDSITNSGSGGIDLTLGKTLLGLIYYYSHISMSSDFLKSNTSSDSNFISLYVAQPLNSYLSLGLTGGYGHTDVSVFLRPTQQQNATRQGSDTDAWTASPFVSLAYAKGNFYASLTTTFQYLHTDADDSGQLNFQVATGYQFAEWLSGEINGKFSQMLYNTRAGVPEDDNWFGIGAKLKQHITPHFAVYEAYEFNVNQTFSENMFSGGLTYSF